METTVQDRSDARADAPLVSIVVPTYRRADKIEPVLRSALAQSVEDVEVVVVDDASQDGTEDVVHGVQDPRVRLLTHEVNRGGNAARLTGIENSRGRYVAFLDSDDIWMPTKLEKQLALLEDKGPEYGLCTTWYQVQTPDGEVTRRQDFMVDGVRVPDLLVENVLGGYSSVLVERDALRRYGGPDPVLRACQDWDLYLRLNQNVGVCVVPEYLVSYVQDLDDPVRISTRRDSVRSGLRHIYDTVHGRADELDDEAKERSARAFLKGFASMGAPGQVAQVAAQALREQPSSDLVVYAAHMQARAVRKLLASRTARQ